MITYSPTNPATCQRPLGLSEPTPTCNRPSTYFQQEGQPRQYSGWCAKHQRQEARIDTGRMKRTPNPYLDLGW